LSEQPHENHMPVSSPIKGLRLSVRRHMSSDSAAFGDAPPSQSEAKSLRVPHVPLSLCNMASLSPPGAPSVCIRRHAGLRCRPLWVSRGDHPRGRFHYRSFHRNDLNLAPAGSRPDFFELASPRNIVCHSAAKGSDRIYLRGLVQMSTGSGPRFVANRSCEKPCKANGPSESYASKLFFPHLPSWFVLHTRLALPPSDLLSTSAPR
jgi:hypothetical protein